MWDLFQLDEENLSPTGSSEGSEHLFVAISQAASTGCVAPKTVQFSGSIQHKQISLLVDSGSSASFISAQLASQLSGVVSLSKDIKVQVAGGAVLVCSQMIPQALWFIGDISFQSDLRVLPLSSYDMIIGMDWLEKHSLMRVHWKHKWLEIRYSNQTVSLQGVLLADPDEVRVQLCILSAEGIHTTDIQLLPSEVQRLIDQFQDLFDSPTGLPPSRACDHEIPLIPGARPVNIRQYRYPPALKNEIEQQVSDMLKQGIIRLSASLLLHQYC
jgi:hypothetical protein